MDKLTKVVVILMTVATIGAVGISLFILMGKDRTAPELIISDSGYEYRTGQSREEMLEGISAVDDQDGDVLDRVIIEKVSINDAGTEADITYAVTDKSNNVAKIVRKAPCAVGGVQDSLEITTQPEKDTQPEEDTAAVPENDAAAVDPEKPVITLTDSEITISQGDNFSVLNYVQEITDNKDERDRLYTNIEVRGSVDTSQTGSYELRYFVTDSDGNKSEEAVLIVNVE